MVDRKEMNWQDFSKRKWVKQKLPVLKAGNIEGWDDYASITPSIWKEDDHKYYMFYTGQGYKSKEWGIGLAVSNNLIHWEKPFKRPIVKVTANGKISSIDGVSLIRNRRYYLFFESKPKISIKSKFKSRFIPSYLKKYLVAVKWGIKDILGLSMAISHADGRKIWMMDSDELLAWDISRARIVFEIDRDGWDSKGVFSPRIFDFNNKFYLIYGGSDGDFINTGIAISSDFYNWNRISKGPILVHGEKGEWDENHALMVDIIKIDDGYVGFYEGEDRHNRYRIGMAYSKDFFNWEKFNGNPIICAGGKGSFDERGVCSPHVMVKNDKYFLFYSAHNKYVQGCCALAISEGI